MSNKKHYTRAVRDWNGDIEFTYEQLPLAYLAAIHRQLEILNAVFQCPNFISIPKKLDIICHNTAKRRRKRK